MNELYENNLNRFLASGHSDPGEFTGTDLEGNPLLPSPGETIDSPWGQSVVDRVVPRYSSEAVRDATILTPTEGQLCYILELDEFQIYNGSEWVDVGDGVYLALSGGVINGQLQIIWDTNQLSLRSEAGGDPQANLSMSNGRLSVRIGDVADFFSPLILSVDDVLSQTRLAVQRADQSTQLQMQNDRGTHKWRYRILDSGGLQLQSAPVGSDTWTTVGTELPGTTAENPVE